MLEVRDAGAVMPPPLIRCDVPSRPIRILIADSHKLVRQGVSARLEMSRRFEVVEHADHGAGLDGIVASLEPDVLLLDFDLPRSQPESLIRRMAANSPSTAVVVLDTHPRAAHMRRVVEAGARGYITRYAAFGELEHALTGAHAGGDPYIEKRFLEGITRNPPAHEQLTPRQQQVLSHLARGRTSKEIAYEFGLSSKTVDIHRTRLMERLNLCSAAAVTMYAVREGLIRL